MFAFGKIEPLLLELDPEHGGSESHTAIVGREGIVIKLHVRTPGTQMQLDAAQVNARRRRRCSRLPPPIPTLQAKHCKPSGPMLRETWILSLIHISEPTRRTP